MEPLAAKLRPKSLEEYIGQQHLVGPGKPLRTAIEKKHLFSFVLWGPPGTGKTTLARIYAKSLDAQLFELSAVSAGKADVRKILATPTTNKKILFLDEIHRMSRAAEEMMYLAMEDFRVDVMVGKGPGATSIPLELPPFTLVGATTRSGMLPAPLRDRFGFTAHLDYYEPADLESIVLRSGRKLDIALEPQAAGEISRRSRGTPRIANRLLRRARDYAQVHHDGVLTLDRTKAALELYEVDDLGLDRLDRAVLSALIDKFDGGPVGLSTLALAVGEEPETVDTVCEPFLVREGFMSRTPRGRVATPAAWTALGRKAPKNVAQMSLEED